MFIETGSSDIPNPVCASGDTDLGSTGECNCSAHRIGIGNPGNPGCVGASFKAHSGNDFNPVCASSGADLGCATDPGCVRCVTDSDDFDNTG